ncbi:MAG: ribosome maturation factor RimM [Ghiorsea sp.]
MLYIGDILNPHGLRGSLIVFSHTRPVDAVAGYLRWYLGKTEDSVQEFTVKDCHQHKKRILAKLEGIDSIEQAETLKGMKIWVADEDVVVEDDEYLWQELIGCLVINQRDEVLGTVSNLHEYGAQDILEVKTNPDAEVSGEWMLPFIEDVVLDVDLDGKTIQIDQLEGMDACFTPKS